MTTARPESRVPRSDRAWRGSSAALLIVIGIVHLHLWLDGYRYLATIGPLFLLDVVAAAILAVVVAVRLNVVVAFAATSLAAGTLGANVLSLLLPKGLFHFKEAGVSYSGGFALASELGVVILLGTWSYLRWRHGDLGLRKRPAVPIQRSVEPAAFQKSQETPARALSSSGSDVTPLRIWNRTHGSRKTDGSLELERRKERTR
jgi:hypothetical protein